MIIKVLKTWWEEDPWVFTWDVLRKDWILQATIYMICPGMICTEENLKKCKEWGVSFIVLGGNPGSGTSIKDVVIGLKKQEKFVEMTC